VGPTVAVTAIIKAINQAFFPGAWLVYLVAAGLAFGAGVASGTYIMDLIYAPKLAQAKQEIQDERGRRGGCGESRCCFRPSR
jgi:hypothetical protein